MESILQDKKECYICYTSENLHCHHVIFGSANRKLSEQYGLKVWLCGFHHNLGGKFCVHENREMDLKLKQIAQARFEETRTRDEFIKIFGKNYLE